MINVDKLARATETATQKPSFYISLLVAFVSTGAGFVFRSLPPLALISYLVFIASLVVFACTFVDRKTFEDGVNYDD